MKNLFLPILLFAASFLASAQPIKKVGTFVAGKKPLTVEKAVEIGDHALSKARSAQSHAILLVTEEFDESDLNQYGWRIIQRGTKYLVAAGPEETSPVLRLLRGVRACIGRGKATPQLAAALYKTNAGAVHVGAGGLPSKVTGRDVLVGIIDLGFDTHHKAFLDSSGVTRFFALWNQNAPYNGTAPFGSVKFRDALIDNPAFGLDAEAHGTHVTGIAAGCDPGKSISGFAPESDIIAVFTRAGLGDILLGAEWIADLADSLKMPCSINISMGNHLGPHDGATYSDALFQDLVESRTGLAISLAAGNEGSKNIHLGMLMSSSWDTIGTFAEQAYRDYDHYYGNSGVFFCSRTMAHFKMRPFAIDTVAWEMLSSSTWISSDTDLVYEPDTVYWAGQSIDERIIFSFETFTDFQGTGKPSIMFTFNSIDKPNVVLGFQTTVSGISTAYVDAWIVNGGRFTDLGISQYPWQSGDNSFSLNNLACGAKMIAVGAYTSTGSYIDAWSQYHVIGSWSRNGEIAPFSSIGPSIRAGIKPNISAPGNEIQSALTSHLQADIPSQKISISTPANGRYCYMPGTSMASPVVAGIIALMYEAYPEFSIDEVMNIIQNTAINDTIITNNYLVPSNTYGYGKIDALACVYSADSAAKANGYFGARITGTMVKGLRKGWRAVTLTGACDTITLYAEATGYPPSTFEYIWFPERMTDSVTTTVPYLDWRYGSPGTYWPKVRIAAGQNRSATSGTLLSVEVEQGCNATSLTAANLHADKQLPQLAIYDLQGRRLAVHAATLRLDTKIAKAVYIQRLVYPNGTTLVKKSLFHNGRRLAKNGYTPQ